MVTVIASKDPPEIFKKRLEDAVKRFYIAVQKEQKEKSAFSRPKQERLTVDI